MKEHLVSWKGARRSAEEEFTTPPHKKEKTKIPNLEMRKSRSYRLAVSGHSFLPGSDSGRSFLDFV